MIHHQHLWKEAIRLSLNFPVNTRSFERVRAIAAVLRSTVPLALTIQDGTLGALEHSWLWVGAPPPSIPCSFKASCDWNGVFRSSNHQHYCSMHMDAVGGLRYPVAHGGVILDVDCPGVNPSVLLLHPHCFAIRNYMPGPARDDIDEAAVSRTTDSLQRTAKAYELRKVSVTR